jgi:predicted Rossmann fold flavoprotein
LTASHNIDLSTPNKYPGKIAVIGGGAAGFFAAINIAEKKPNYKIMILEKTGKVLQKVKISGGGRCNVTNACFNPKELSKNYPRGGKQLIPLFHRFQPRDTMEWFKLRGVKIKTEPDNRAFPESDNSQSIIDCFLNTTDKCGIIINLHHDVIQIRQPEGDNPRWGVILRDNRVLEFDAVVIATGGVPSMWKLLAVLGHTIISPVPSLFTFNINDARLNNLKGVSFPSAKCRISGTKTEDEGALLITHWGLSGPAILKLSAFAARELYEKKYRFELSINFAPGMNFDKVRDSMFEIKEMHQKKLVKNTSPVPLPASYWKSILNYCQIPEEFRWLDMGKKQINKIAEEISNAIFLVDGKSTFKEEFVTCGGIDLDEVDLRTMESKLFPGLFFAGEVLNIDAVTGGFNFQAAWTTAWIVSEAI